METTAKNIHAAPGRALGKRDPSNRKSISFGDFLKAMPTSPLVDLAPMLNYPMDGNDRVGDCVVAGWDHSSQAIKSLLTAINFNYTQDQIWQFYKTQNPDFDPNGTQYTNGAGSSADRGMDMQIFLEYLVNNKYIVAFAHTSWMNQEELAAAIYLGLSVMIGVQLQQAQMGQQFENGVLDYVPGSPNEGGHCMAAVGFDKNDGSIQAITWGKVVKCTKAFIQNQVDEAWFILTQEHLDHPGFRNSFDLPKFADAVNSLTEGKVVIPVPVTPTTPPTPTGFVFTKDLYFGISNTDVMQLQKRLATEQALDGHMCYRYTSNGALYFSNNFGLNTRDAVTRYQDKHGIRPDSGYCGPTTRGILNGSVVAASSLIGKWADAIQVHEGWTPGSHSYRNNNPGNLRYVGQANATPDSTGFCVFPTYALGRQALINMLTADCTGKSTIYSPEMSLLQYYQKYAPAADSNDPVAYATFIASQLGVSINTQIKNLA